MKEQTEKSRYPPRGLCRYCCNAAYQDDGYAVCTGKEHYRMAINGRTKRTNCNDYDMCINDVFSPDYMENGEFHKYTPRKAKQNSENEYEQLKLF